MSDQLWWYVARAGGVVAWSLAAVAVLLGLALSTRTTAWRVGRPWLLDLHRFLGGGCVVFTAIHLGGLWADSYVYFGPSELFVPLASTWRPGAVAWGIVGLYLLLAIELTSLLRDRLPEQLWRGVHYGSFGVLVFGTVHAVQAGTDVGNPLLRWPGVASLVVAAVMLAYRIGQSRRARGEAADRAAALAAAAAKVRSDTP